jgi:hypothetical protein
VVVVEHATKTRLETSVETSETAMRGGEAKRDMMNGKLS